MAYNFPIGPTVALNASPNAPFPIITHDLYRSTEWVAKAGFDSIEYHIRDPKAEVDGPRLKACADACGLRVSTIGTGMAYGAEGLSITSPDADVRARAIRRLKDQVELAAVVGGHVVIGSMRGVIPESGSFAQTDARMVESMKELADYAEKYKVLYVIEAIDRFETNYLQTAQDVLELIDRVGSAQVCVHLDSYHMNIEEADWVKPILACKDKLRHVHLAENTRNYPGSALIPFPIFLQALEQIGYQDTLTLECYPWPDGETAALEGMRYLRSL